MRVVAARLFRLFVDSGWLAGGALLCVLACVVLRRLGLPPGPAGWLLLLALVATLAACTRADITRK